jgi:isoleucyl-tRNA synthetase
VIFRATPQWFISMEKTDLRKKSLAEIDRVEWIPRWGRDRIYGMIENRPDWCVSRQRAWGVPIPIFYCEDCEALYLNDEMVDRVYRLFREHGADVWVERDAADLLPPGARCPGCAGGRLKKETDILDVWFDSGVSHAAVLEERPDLAWPADLYLEGSDQHRGWFHSSLLTAVGTRNRAPYKSVLTHGFVVDAEGRKMSKSVGNVVAPKAVIDRYGAEILRLWVSASDFKDDIRISEKILTQLSDAYRRIRNTCRFILGNLFDFNPSTDAVSYGALSEMDRFALHKLRELVRKCRKAYETFDFHVIYHALYNYCTLDLSAFYLDVLKDRLYTSSPGAAARREAQTVIHFQLDALARLMAPILPFTSEDVWKFMPDAARGEESVHLAPFPDVPEAWRDETLSKRWERLLEIRSEASRALEVARSEKRIGHSLDAAVTIGAEGELYQLLSRYAGDLKTILIVSSVSLIEGPLDAGRDGAGIEGLSFRIEPAHGKKCARCWIYETSVGEFPEHPEICGRCHAALSEV